MTITVPHPRRFAARCAWRVAVCLSLSSAALATDSARETISLDQDWRFHLGNVTNAIAPGFDDHEWRQVDVPHDYVVEGAFATPMPADSVEDICMMGSPVAGILALRLVALFYHQMTAFYTVTAEPPLCARHTALARRFCWRRRQSASCRPLLPTSPPDGHRPRLAWCLLPKSR